MESPTQATKPALVTEKPPQSEASAGSGTRIAPDEERPTKDVNKPEDVEAGGKEEGKKSALEGWLEKLPDWLSASLRDRRKWKTFLRVMVAFFANLILLVCTNTLNILGQAAFFGSIVAIMLPPSMPSTLFLFVCLTLVLGMCIGWAWSVAAMAAALKSRSAEVLASAYTTANGRLVAGSAPDVQFRSFVFEGVFLDTRSTIVFGIFFFVGTYAMGSIRALAPKLTLLAVFGTIVMDVMMSYGPLFPSAQYTLATTFLIPTGCYIAIALLSIFLIFPQTLHHAVLSGYTAGFLRPGNSLLALQSSVLRTAPGDFDAWTGDVAKARALRKGFTAGLLGVAGQAGLLGLEVSYGRFGAGELKGMIGRGKVLGGRLLGVASFQLLVEEAHKTDTADEAKELDKTYPHRSLRIDQYRAVNKTTEQSNGHGLDTLLPILSSSSADLRSACESSLTGAIDWLEWVNSHRWARGAKVYPPDEGSAAAGVKVRTEALEALKVALAEFRGSRHLELLEPFRRMFDPSTGELLTFGEGGDRLKRLKRETELQLSTRSLYLGFVFATSLIAYASALVDYLEYLLEVEKKSPVNKIQWPISLGRIVEIATKDDGQKVNGVEMGTGDPDRDAGEQSDDDSEDGSSQSSELKKEKSKKGKAKKVKQKKVRQLDPDVDADAKPSRVQSVARVFSAMGRWQSSPQGLFALKYALVSIALWVPAICPSSAYFTYSNRGLWALIMAQTGLGVWTGELISQFLLRITGTLIGLVVGMVCWYIGNGNGDGNAYGFVAATMVICAPFLYLRMVSPPEMMSFFLMIGVTTVLIVGYGWVDTHIGAVGNPGVGYSIAWKRALLVIIGFVGAFIITAFPFKPQGAKKTLRHSFAKTMDMLASLYMSEMRGILDEARTDRHEEDIEKRETAYRSEFLGIFAKLQEIEPMMGFARFEPGRGPWPRKKYEAMMATMQRLLGAQAILGNAWSRMEPAWDKVLLERTAFLDPTLIADVMSIMALMSHSLRNGVALPPTMVLNERLANLSIAARRAQLAKFATTGGGIADRENEIVDIEEHAGISLNWDKIQSEQLAVYATATVALSHIIQSIDQLYEIVRSLVGEKTIDSLEDWQAEKARRDVDATFGAV